LNPVAVRNLVMCLEVRNPQFVRNFSKQEQNFMQQMWQARHPGTHLVFSSARFTQQKGFTGWVGWERTKEDENSSNS